MYNTLVTLASSAAGGVVGGNAGAGAAFNEVTNNYLTPKQEFAKDAEKAACKGKLSCLSAVELKYGLISGKQNVGLLVGIGGGIGLQGYQQVENVVDMVANWSDTQKTLVALVNDPAFRSKVGDSIVQDYRQRIDLLTKAYNDGGWDGSVTAGVEAGRLAVDVVGAATAAMGAGKVAVTAAKAGANVAGQAISKSAAIIESSNLAKLGAIPRPIVNPIDVQKMVDSGIKFTPQKLIATGRNVEGKIVFLEVGSSSAGLQHIIERHAIDFINKGISQIDIPSVVMEAVTKGKVVGMNGSAPVYQVMYNGSAKYVSVGVGSNGFIVRANPVSEWKPLK
ncbi:hypothetical protein VI06_16765 [Aquitalea magnusonii]|nr:hypothetical protein VI06_16765 [Aquitalea magnusonii]